MLISMNNYQTLINALSLTHGLISFLLNTMCPCPGSEFIVMLFLFSICFACFVEMLSKSFYL